MILKKWGEELRWEGKEEQGLGRRVFRNCTLIKSKEGRLQKETQKKE